MKLLEHHYNNLKQIQRYHSWMRNSGMYDDIEDRAQSKDYSNRIEFLESIVVMSECVTNLSCAEFEEKFKVKRY